MERVLRLVGDVEIDDALVAYSNGCSALGFVHHHGSQLLAAVMDRWPSFSRSGSRRLLRFHQCLKEWRQLTLARTQQAVPASAWEGIAQRSPFGSVHPRRPGDVHSPVRASGVEKERCLPTTCDTAPMLVSCDRSFQNWSVHQDRGPS